MVDEVADFGEGFDGGVDLVDFGGREAEDYIENEFRKLKLEPGLPVLAGRKRVRGEPRLTLNCYAVGTLARDAR